MKKTPPESDATTAAAKLRVSGRLALFDLTTGFYLPVRARLVWIGLVNTAPLRRSAGSTTHSASLFAAHC
jgi:hypothetical protein